MAMMCRTRLMRRFPARDSRWRFWSPEDASIGAVPFQEAKWARLVNRPMSPMSPSRRAAPDGPMPCRCCRRLPVLATSSVSCWFAILIFLSIDGEFVDQFGGQLAAGLADDVTAAGRC